MSADAAEKTKFLYHLTIQLVKGKAKRIAMSSPRGEGFALWWTLVRQYESQVEGRHQAMLVQIMRPIWPSDLTGEKFQEALLQWELDIQNYEHQSGELLPDKTKIAIVIASAPRAFRAAIATGHPSNRATYTALKVSLETLIQAERVYDGSGFRKDDAMQVDALQFGKNNHTKGKHGKSGGKDGGKHKSGGGKDKEQHHQKGGRKGKDGKKHVKGKDKNHKPKFDGYCNACKKYGHTEADCWAKHGKQTAAVSGQPAITDGSDATIQKVEEADENFGFPGGAHCRMCWLPVCEKRAIIVEEDMFHPNVRRVHPDGRLDERGG